MQFSEELQAIGLPFRLSLQLAEINNENTSTFCEKCIPRLLRQWINEMNKFKLYDCLFTICNTHGNK